MTTSLAWCTKCTCANHSTIGFGHGQKSLRKTTITPYFFKREKQTTTKKRQLSRPQTCLGWSSTFIIKQSFPSLSLSPDFQPYIWSKRWKNTKKQVNNIWCICWLIPCTTPYGLINLFLDFCAVGLLFNYVLNPENVSLGEKSVDTGFLGLAAAMSSWH